MIIADGANISNVDSGNRFILGKKTEKDFFYSELTRDEKLVHVGRIQNFIFNFELKYKVDKVSKKSGPVNPRSGISGAIEPSAERGLHKVDVAIREVEKRINRVAKIFKAGKEKGLPDVTILEQNIQLFLDILKLPASDRTREKQKSKFKRNFNDPQETGATALEYCESVLLMALNKPVLWDNNDFERIVTEALYKQAPEYDEGEDDDWTVDSLAEQQAQVECAASVIDLLDTKLSEAVFAEYAFELLDIAQSILKPPYTEQISSKMIIFAYNDSEYGINLKKGDLQYLVDFMSGIQTIIRNFQLQHPVQIRDYNELILSKAQGLARRRIEGGITSQQAKDVLMENVKNRAAHFLNRELGFHDESVGERSALVISQAEYILNILGMEDLSAENRHGVLVLYDMGVILQRFIAIGSEQEYDKLVFDTVLKKHPLEVQNLIFYLEKLAKAGVLPNERLRILNYAASSLGEVAIATGVSTPRPPKR